jgi:hypothetical protein
MPFIAQWFGPAKENITQYFVQIPREKRHPLPLLLAPVATVAANFTLHIRLNLVYMFGFQILGQPH